MECESCGMPMGVPEDYGSGDVNCKYCRYCAPDGNLRAKEEVRTGWINAVVKMEGIAHEEAEIKVDRFMTQMPAWMEQP